MSFHMTSSGLPPASQTFHASLLQLIDGLTQQVHPQTKYILMGQLTNNMQLITNLHQYVLQEARTLGIDLTAANASIHPQDLNRILYTWCQAVIATIRNQAPAPMMGGGMVMTPPGMFGGGLAPANSPATMYSSGTATTNSPMIALPTSMPGMDNYAARYSPQPGLPVQINLPGPGKETPPMDETLTFGKEAIDDVARFDHHHGLEIIDTTWVANWQNHRVTLMTLNSQRVANNAFEAYRDMDSLLPGDMKRGYWANRLFYTEIGHIPLNTHTFLDLRDQIRKRYDEAKWQAVISVLETATQGTWSIIDSYLTERINQELQLYLRSEAHIDLVLSISSINDLTELYSPHFTSPLAEHLKFADTLEQIIHRVMFETFIHNSLSVTDKKEMSALLKCRAVDYFEGGVTKYDYGMLDPKDRDALLEKLYNKHTLLSLPRCLLATNTLPAEEIVKLNDPSYILPLNRQGIFPQLVKQLTLDKRPMPHMVVINRYRVAPMEAMNIVRPAYAMGDNVLYLSGSNRIIGW